MVAVVDHAVDEVDGNGTHKAAPPFWSMMLRFDLPRNRRTVDAARPLGPDVRGFVPTEESAPGPVSRIGEAMPRIGTIGAPAWHAPAPPKRRSGRRG